MGRSVISPSYMSEVLRLNPDSLLFARYAHTLIVSKKLNAAQKIAEEGVEKFPNYAGGRFILALCYAEQGDKKTAVLQLIEVLKVEPTFQQAIALLVKLISSDGVTETSSSLISFLANTNPKTRLLGKFKLSGSGKKNTVFEIFSCEHNWKEYASENYGKEKKSHKAEDSDVNALGGSLEQEISEAIYQDEIPEEEKTDMPPEETSEKAEGEASIESESENEIPAKDESDAENEITTKSQEEEENSDKAHGKKPKKGKSKIKDKSKHEKKQHNFKMPDVIKKIVSIFSSQDAEKSPLKDKKAQSEPSGIIKLPTKNSEDVQPDIDNSALASENQDKKEEISGEIETAAENIQTTDVEDSPAVDNISEDTTEIQEAEVTEDVISETSTTDLPENSETITDNISEDTTEIQEEEITEDVISETSTTDLPENSETITDDISQETQEIKTDETNENPVEIVENKEESSAQASETDTDSTEKDTANVNEEFAELKNIVEESIENLPTEVSLNLPETEEVISNDFIPKFDNNDFDNLVEDNKKSDDVLLETPEKSVENQEPVSDDSEQNFNDKLSDTFDDSFEDYLKNSQKIEVNKQDAGDVSEIALENSAQKFDIDEQKAEPLSEKEAFGFLIAKNGGEQLPDHILTPTFAQIYLEQGQPYLAKQIYERLMLQDGENEEFAEKIEEIDDIIERMKKGENISFETLDFSEEKSVKRSLKGKRIKKEIREALIEKYFTKDEGEKDDGQI